MKLLYLLTFVILGFTTNAQSPVANAGPDQTIYLTQTSTVTLNGSASSGDSYKWTEVSTDYKSGATISSPNSAVTTVSGLPQGVFYFQLAVTSGGMTTTDVVVVRVDYDVPPTNSTLLRGITPVLSGMVPVVNDRSDTTNFIAGQESHVSFPDNTNGEVFYDRARSNGLFIDGQLGKFYSILEDGFQWNNSGYNRSEMSFGSGWTLAAGVTYCFDWKGYFPQLLETNQEIVVIWQLHGNDGDSPPFALRPSGGNLIIEDLDAGNKSVICSLADLVNQAHSIRIIIKEGLAGDNGYIKVEYDGVQKYSRTTGQVGRLSDYPKFATLYDWSNTVVDANNHTRNKKFPLVTENFNIYKIDGSLAVSKPNVDAGSDQTITLPTNSVNLSGTGSVSGGSIQNYNWTKLSGPTGETITSPNSSSTSVTNLVQGTYIFQLKVTDNNGASATSSVQVTVNAAAQNSPPKASAGENQIITLPANSTNLSGSATDSDGTIASYLWTKTAGPSEGVITSSSSSATSITGLVQGSYTFQLKVIDNNGASGTDTVNVTVLSATNISPIAKAGNDTAITLPLNYLTLNGKGIDQDGNIASYKWTKISGDSAVKISNVTSSTTDINNLIEGNYQFELKVTDNQGAIGKDTVSVSVKAAANLVPNVAAGANETITLPTNSLVLNGTANDSDGTIASFAWTKTGGPSQGTISDPTSASTSVNGLVEGDYTFTLKATDNLGAIGKDTVHVKVNAADNLAPTASAGTDQVITLPDNIINLSGSGSDSDGNIASYLWTKTAGPSQGTITDTISASTSVNGLVEGDYTFTLKVTDNAGAIGKDTVHVKVNAANNLAPTASAGIDQVITLPDNSVNLSGSGSDSDGNIASYLWTKTAGPSQGTITDSISASTSVNGLVEGDYTFTLKVTDNAGVIGKDTVHVKVNAANNLAPTASAGTDQVITLPDNTVNLSGSGSDSDGTISKYNWSKLSGPSTFTIVDSSSPSTNVSGLIQGVYEFELKVVDNNGSIGKDTVEITVNAANNMAPSANAGVDQIIILPVNEINLTGIATDSDGTISSYKWTKISGPSSSTIKKPNSVSVNITNLVEGVYQFEFSVTDDKGASGKDTVQITVNAASNVDTAQTKSNVAPKASAGSDQVITLPTNSINLSGTGTDSDGSISKYYWSKISGPTTFKIADSSSAATTVSEMVQGVYQFELDVTDDKGAIGKDTVQVTVNAASNVDTVQTISNVAPKASAGSDQVITLPTNSINLSGTGADSDGSISKYYWSKISGPTTFKIADSSSASTSVSEMVEGVYQFELKVTDDKGAVGKDTVQVTVKAATKVDTVQTPANLSPKADAGSDQVITLPTNSVTVSGSGNDVDGVISSYSWTRISGPSSFSIQNSSSPVALISGLIAGVYQFELKVTDDKGATGKDTVQVTVNSVNNLAPSADAGSDLEITLPIDSIKLSGTGKDSDGTISGYLWTKISGPSSYTISSSTSASTVVNGLVQGIYEFELKVTDDKGSLGRDTVKVTVNSEVISLTPVNQAPTVNAGSDITIVSTTNSIMLKGSGADVDGQIKSYSWKQLSGPSICAISSPNSVNTKVSNFIQGTYEFELTGIDDKGGVGKDSVKVTVAMERVATETTTTSGLNVYPNPVHDIANLQFTTSESNSNISIVISDMSGKTVYTKQYVSASTNVLEQIDMSNLIKGIYSLSVYIDGMQQQSVKVVKL